MSHKTSAAHYGDAPRFRGGKRPEASRLDRPETPRDATETAGDAARGSAVRTPMERQRNANLWCHACCHDTDVPESVWEDDENEPACPLCGSTFVEKRDGTDAIQYAEHGRRGEETGERTVTNAFFLTSRGIWPGNDLFLPANSNSTVDSIHVSPTLNGMISLADIIGGSERVNVTLLSPQLDGDILDGALDEESVDRLMDSLPASSAESVESTTCAICHELLSHERNAEPVDRESDVSDSPGSAQLPCGHAFHRACVAKWLRRRRNCPVCRHTL